MKDKSFKENVMSFAVKKAIAYLDDKPESKLC